MDGSSEGPRDLTKVTQLVTGTELESLDYKMGVGGAGIRELGLVLQVTEGRKPRDPALLLALARRCTWQAARHSGGSGSGLLPPPSSFLPVSIFNPVYSRIIVGVLEKEKKNHPSFSWNACQGNTGGPVDVGYNYCGWSSACYRSAPSVPPRLIFTVTLWQGMLPFSGTGIKGPEGKGYPTLHQSSEGEGAGKGLQKFPRLFHRSRLPFLVKDPSSLISQRP